MEVEIIKADITTVSVDAIVNAANSSLLGGGGVDGAIHKAAGRELLDACRNIRSTSYPHGLPVGEAVATSAFALPSQYVIHTVAPNRHAGQLDQNLLQRAYASSMKIAANLHLRTVAFPALGAGAYGWSGEASAIAARRAIGQVFNSTASSTQLRSGTASPTVEKIVFALFSEQMRATFQEVFDRE